MESFLCRPLGTISEILVFPPGLIARRLMYLCLDALRLVGRTARGK